MLLGDQLFVEGHAAPGDQLADLGAEALPEERDRQLAARLDERGRLLAQAEHGAGGATIGADAIGIPVAQFEVIEKSSNAVVPSASV